MPYSSGNPTILPCFVGPFNAPLDVSTASCNSRTKPTVGKPLDFRQDINRDEHNFGTYLAMVS